jgi:tetratricopeptide (TPR) repeat protein
MQCNVSRILPSKLPSPLSASERSLRADTGTDQAQGALADQLDQKLALAAKYVGGAAAAADASQAQQALNTLNRGALFGQLGRNDEAVAAYDEVIARFKDAGEPRLREQVAMALVNKGARLGQLGRNDEAVATYDEVIGRFTDAVEPGLREQVAKALLNKGVMLGQLGRGAEAVAVYTR